MSDQDPTRPQEPVPGSGPQEPTSVVRTTETAGPRRPPADPRPPGGGGVAVGLAVAAALVVGLIGLLAGIVLFGEDDDDAGDIEAVEDTIPEGTEGTDPSELEAERDQLAQQVEDLESEVTDLQSQLDEVTQERDELRSQLESAQDDQIETVPATDVVGGSVSDAEAAADDNGWILVERTVDSGPGDAEPGTVVAQYPEAGAPMIEGSALVIDVLQEDDGGS